MSLTIPVIAADGGQSTVVLPDPVVTAASTYPDGSAGAPSGTPQHLHLLDLSAAKNENGIAPKVRPQWKVAGVDYRVGIQTGVALKPVTGGGLPPGFVISGTAVVYSGSAPGTINGYDFSAAANGGVDYNLSITGSAAVTVTNCNIVQRAANASGAQPIKTAINTGQLTVKYCVFDGNGAAMTLRDDLAMIQLTAGGGTVQYCWFKNGVSDAINVVGKNGPIPLVDVRFNLAENLGLGAPATGDTAHADFLQSWVLTGGSGSDINNLVCNFNTMYQPAAVPNANGHAVPVGVDSLMLLQTGAAGAGGGGQINSPECGYNTCVGIGLTHYNFGNIYAGQNKGTAWDEWITLQGTSGNPINSPYIHDNYIYADTTLAGTDAGFLNFPFYPSKGQFIVNQNYARNINMFDGSSYTTSP